MTLETKTAEESRLIELLNASEKERLSGSFIRGILKLGRERKILKLCRELENWGYQVNHNVIRLTGGYGQSSNSDHIFSNELGDHRLVMRRNNHSFCGYYSFEDYESVHHDLKVVSKESEETILQIEDWGARRLYRHLKKRK